VGRISAQIDQLHLELHGENEGFFGMIEATICPSTRNRGCWLMAMTQLLLC
jgi:hypothetical protein